MVTYSFPNGYGPNSDGEMVNYRGTTRYFYFPNNKEG